MTSQYRSFTIAAVLAFVVTATLSAQTQLPVEQPAPVTIALAPDVPKPDKLEISRFEPADLQQSEIYPEFTIWPAPPPLPSGIAIPKAQLGRLIAGLTSDSTKVRSEAERRLIRGGPSAIDALTDSVKTQPEVYRHLVPALLERIMRQCDFDSARAAEQALLELTESDDDLVQRTAKIFLENCEVVRTQRAVEDICMLGGYARFSTDFYDIDTNGQLYPSMQYIVIDENCNDSVAFLEAFMRLPLLPTLYLIEGHPLSQDQIVKLKNARPKLQFETRAKVQLGVQSVVTNPNIVGVFLHLVSPRSSAAKAGLRSGDVVIKFGNTEVFTFPDLQKALMGRAPGDVVEVKFLRKVDGEEQEQTTNLTLQGWSKRP